MARHFMLIPSLACPASCAYCFGPHQGGPLMQRETVEAIIRWQNTLNESNDPIEVTFHGGEPLVPGADFYHMALPLIQKGMAPRKVHFGLQSNLWLLTDELCELFEEYNVSIGTSLDGPEQINDTQRGRGYFRRTMNGINLAHTHGLGIGCICTFTSKSAELASDVFDFFLSEGLGFSIHAALSPLGHSGYNWALYPESYGQLLVEMLDLYVKHTDKIRINTLDSLCQSISAQKGGTCVFGDCLGKYLAVDPEGWIYPCQRFAGMPRFRLGNVHDHPTMNELSNTPFWCLLSDRQKRIEDECGDCPYLEICRGGCPYNVLVENKGSFEKTLRDPYCPAYQRIFSNITERALEEVFSEENMSSVVEKGSNQYGLLQEGTLLQIMRGGPHPHDIARRAREIVAAAALAVSDSPAHALHKLDRIGIITQPSRALASLTALQKRLNTQSQEGLINAYLHVTYRCNLQCNHCYARSQPGNLPFMMVNDVGSLLYQIAEAGFRKAVITGGEPTFHPQRDVLLDLLAKLRDDIKPLRTVLRTNLAYLLSSSLVKRITSSTDQVVVSVDGDENSHNYRRGEGTYKRTVENLKTLLSANPNNEIMIAAVLTPEEMDGSPGEAVRVLGEELDIRVRFKTVLPLGRGSVLDLSPSFYSFLEDDKDQLVYGSQPASTCGLGMNLYIGPDGVCYPCYTLMSERHQLGSAIEEGLPAILERNDTYRQVTVDSNTKCRNCELRYLCGGFCRAWSSKDDPDASPIDCSALYARAQNQLLRAAENLHIPIEKWEAADLPLLYASAFTQEEHTK